MRPHHEDPLESGCTGHGDLGTKTVDASHPLAGHDDAVTIGKQLRPDRNRASSSLDPSRTYRIDEPVPLRKRAQLTLASANDDMSSGGRGRAQIFTVDRADLMKPRASTLNAAPLSPSNNRRSR